MRPDGDDARQARDDAETLPIVLPLGLLIAGTRVLQAAPEDVRVIDKLVKDFPEKTDLSTPESAAV